MLMFVHIFYTFCKMIILTSLLIFAFSLAFYMTFFDPSDNFAVRDIHSIIICLVLIIYVEICLCYSWSSYSQDYDNDYGRV